MRKTRDHDSVFVLKNQMERWLFLDVVVCKSSLIFQLLSSKNQTLLIRGDSFLVLNFLLDVVNRIRWFNFQRDGLSSKSLYKDLHLSYRNTISVNFYGASPSPFMRQSFPWRTDPAGQGGRTFVSGLSNRSNIGRTYKYT